MRKAACHPCTCWRMLTGRWQGLRSVGEKAPHSLIRMILIQNRAHSQKHDAAVPRLWLNIPTRDADFRKDLNTDNATPRFDITSAARQGSSGSCEVTASLLAMDRVPLRVPLAKRRLSADNDKKIIDAVCTSDSVCSACMPLSLSVFAPLCKPRSIPTLLILCVSVCLSSVCFSLSVFLFLFLFVSALVSICGFCLRSSLCLVIFACALALCHCISLVVCLALFAFHKFMRLLLYPCPRFYRFVVQCLCPAVVLLI